MRIDVNWCSDIKRRSKPRSLVLAMSALRLHMSCQKFAFDVRRLSHVFLVGMRHSSREHATKTVEYWVFETSGRLASVV